MTKITVKLWLDEQSHSPTEGKWRADVEHGLSYHSFGDTPQQALLRLAKFWDEKEQNNEET